MPKKLKKLQITRIDLVPAGANPDAHIRLYKAADPAPVDKAEYSDGDGLPLTTEQILQRNQLWQQWHPLWDAFTTSVWEAMSCCEEAEHHAPVLLQSIDQFATKARGILTGLGLVDKAAPLLDLCGEVEKAGRVMSAQRMRRLKDAITTLQTMLDEAMASSTKPTPATKGADPMAETAMIEAAAHAVVVKERDEAVKRAEAAEAKAEAAEKELTQLRMTPEEQEAEYMKSLPAGLRKQLEADKVEKAELREALRVEKEKRERQEYITKATEFAHVGMTPDDDWETLQAIDKMEEKPRARVLQLLKAAGEQLRASKLLRRIGSDSHDASGNAEDRALLFAKELVQNKEASSIGDALPLVWKAHPDLYQEYQAEKRRQSRIRE